MKKNVFFFQQRFSFISSPKIWGAEMDKIISRCFVFSKKIFNPRLGLINVEGWMILEMLAQHLINNANS